MVRQLSLPVHFNPQKEIRSSTVIYLVLDPAQCRIHQTYGDNPQRTETNTGIHMSTVQHSSAIQKAAVHMHA